VPTLTVWAERLLEVILEVRAVCVGGDVFETLASTDSVSDVDVYCFVDLPSQPSEEFLIERLTADLGVLRSCRVRAFFTQH
jgi:hypothetical protein